MAWNYEQARRRIIESISSSPTIRVETFDQYSPRIRALRAEQRRPIEPNVIRDLGPNEAIIAETVQVYVNVINYSEMRLEAGRETEASHARALSFLHLHYAALDRASDGVEAQRVDFHGPRMHAVVIVPSSENPGSRQEAVRRAIRLARETIDLSEAGSRELLRSSVKPKFRIGIDIGRCVAVDSGRQDEREPLFIGRAANYAAKLAEGDDEGVFISDRVRALFNMPGLASDWMQENQPVTSLELNSVIRDNFQADSAIKIRKLNEMREDLRSHRDTTIGTDGFVFHYHMPPLRSIDYVALKPSNSIRMPLVSIFADLDGYTAYIDSAIQTSQIGQAVRDLHVLRAELNAVLQDDFDGRKVRFIGDCLHGVIAVGSAREVDLVATVEEATRCAGALRSSFDLCLQHLPSATTLGLAIGYELGPTPISRIGIRGERAVRVASSVATLVSEQCQAECNGQETKIGPEALRYAPVFIQALFDDSGIGVDIDFDTVAIQSPRHTGSQVSEPVAESRHHLM